jgi:hypothetical protein
MHKPAAGNGSDANDNGNPAIGFRPSADSRPMAESRKPISDSRLEGDAPRDLGQDTLLEAHQQILSEDPEIKSAQYALKATLAVVQQEKNVPSLADAGTGKYIRYQHLIRQIRELVHGLLPPEACVIVVSKGDNDLLNLGSARAWHFPQSADGSYAGHYPSDSMVAIAHLEELRAKGGDYLLLPGTAFWWLDHYGDFRRHLDSQYRRLWGDERCIIYQLRKTAAPRESIWHAPLRALRGLWNRVQESRGRGSP